MLDLEQVLESGGRRKVMFDANIFIRNLLRAAEKDGSYTIETVRTKKNEFVVRLKESRQIIATLITTANICKDLSFGSSQEAWDLILEFNERLTKSLKETQNERPEQSNKKMPLNKLLTKEEMNQLYKIGTVEYSQAKGRLAILISPALGLERITQAIAHKGFHWKEANGAYHLIQEGEKEPIAVLKEVKKGRQYHISKKGVEEPMIAIAFLEAMKPFPNKQTITFFDVSVHPELLKNMVNCLHR